MGKHARDGLAVVGLGHLLDSISNGIILATGLNETEGNFGGIVGSQQNFGRSALDLVLGRCAYDESMGSQSHVAIDMNAEVARMTEEDRSV